MAGPVAAFVQLPADSNNTGKKNRTQTKIVGANTVNEHFVVPSHSFTRTGYYILQTTGDVVAATSQTGTGSAFYWMNMSTLAATTNAVALIRKISVSYGIGGAIVISTASPVLNFTKYTYNGAASSAASVAPLANATGTPAPLMSVITTSSGATITLVRDVANFVVPALVTTAGTYGGNAVIYETADPYTRGTALELKSGEGLVIYQSQAGVGSDVRKFTAHIEWDEIDIS